MRRLFHRLQAFSGDTWLLGVMTVALSLGTVYACYRVTQSAV